MNSIKLLIFILLINCNLNFKEDFNGISDLRLKMNNIRIKETNQNDVINFIGKPIIIDTFDKNIWSYYETKSRTNFFGTKKIYSNDVLILKFNDVGIVIDYIIYDLNSMNELKFDQKITKSFSESQDSLTRVLLSSTKKRFDMLNKSKSKEDANEQ